MIPSPIARDSRVVHWHDTRHVMRVADIRGAFACCEWLDQGLPRRRVYPLIDLLDAATTGRFEVPPPPPPPFEWRIRGLWE